LHTYLICFSNLSTTSSESLTKNPLILDSPPPPQKSPPLRKKRMRTCEREDHAAVSLRQAAPTLCDYLFLVSSDIFCDNVCLLGHQVSLFGRQSAGDSPDSNWRNCSSHSVAAAWRPAFSTQGERLWEWWRKQQVHAGIYILSATPTRPPVRIRNIWLGNIMQAVHS